MQADREGELAAYRRLHRSAVELLEGWQAPDQGQAALRAGFLGHLSAHQDALSKEGPPAHLTASCLVLDESGERVLLTHHRKAREWFQFGGHVEQQDRDVHAAATREVREESGIEELTPFPALVQLHRHRLTAAFGRCREHLDLRFVAVAREGAVPRVSAESLDVRWWPVVALPAGSREDLLPLVRSASALLG